MLPINPLKSKLRYSNPFQNAIEYIYFAVSISNKGWFADFFLLLVAMATSLE